MVNGLHIMKIEIRNLNEIIKTDLKTDYGNYFIILEN
jgi:hypothetical protein